MDGTRQSGKRTEGVPRGGHGGGEGRRLYFKCLAPSQPRHPVPSPPLNAMAGLPATVPNLPPPATRERPPGCKTVFVGGLPENATEQLIVEVFEQCGEIIAIRKSKKNFCHIRFAEEYTVDKALFLSGAFRRAPSCPFISSHSDIIHLFFPILKTNLFKIPDPIFT
ncbi:hypothetical protein JZ751_029395 [Albula glossodonta]|uniref:RRM domain-containing protein n=1 Tax=Albula glossodonta TaxID=121402 RepID=A0A8T2PBI0_9TELE|nr:hypothetical protein JZ751_029395 [Albula glossodonta]